MTELVRISTRFTGIRNRARNGGFEQRAYSLNKSITGVTKKLNTSLSSYLNTGETNNTFLGSWLLTCGAGKIDVLAEEWLYDSGTAIKVKFLDDGDQFLTMTQDLDDPTFYRGRKITIAAGIQKGDLRTKVELQINGETVATRYSDYYNDYIRFTGVAEVPIDAVKITVGIKISSSIESASCYLSGIVVVVGDYAMECPYANNPADVAFPSGMIIFYEKEIPQGFISLTGQYLFQIFSDPCFTNEQKVYDTIGRAAHNHFESDQMLRVGQNEVTTHDLVEINYRLPENATINHNNTNDYAQNGWAAAEDPNSNSIIVQNHNHSIALKQNAPVDPKFMALRICEKI